MPVKRNPLIFKVRWVSDKNYPKTMNGYPVTAYDNLEGGFLCMIHLCAPSQNMAKFHIQKVDHAAKHVTAEEVSRASDWKRGPKYNK
jgi:hypothetical protein